MASCSVVICPNLGSSINCKNNFTFSVIRCFRQLCVWSFCILGAGWVDCLVTVVSIILHPDGWGLVGEHLPLYVIPSQNEVGGLKPSEDAL